MSKWTPEQQKEHRVEWVAALRSGRYKQGRECLRESATGAMCCLGVACDLSKLGKWEPSGSGKITVYRVRLSGNAYQSNAYHLPEAVQEYYGLAHDQGLFYKQSLVRLNDHDKFTFSEIADLIESEPEGLIADECK